MFHRVLVSTIALTVFALFAGPVWAQLNPSSNPLIPLSGLSVVNPGDSTPVMGTSSISGSVTGQDNSPVRNARVEIRNLMSGAVAGYGYTEAAGTFELRNLRPGAYEVVVTLGLSGTHEQVRLDGSPVQLTIRMPFSGTTQANASGQQTVSVQSLQVPDKARDALQKARDAAGKGKGDVALREIENALRIFPRYSDALAARGILEMQNGDLNAAGDDFQKAIEVDSNNAIAYTAMGSIYNLRSQFNDAMRELDRAVTLSPTAWQTHYEISKAHLGQGDFTTALSEVNKAQQLMHKDFGAIHLVKGQALLGIKAFAQAVAELRKFLEGEKDSPAAAQIKGLIAQAEASAATTR